VINLGTNENAKNVNLGIGNYEQEKESCIKIFITYEDVFKWTYDDLKTYDMHIIQLYHTHEEGC